MLTIFPENRLNADKLIQILSDRRKAILLEISKQAVYIIYTLLMGLYQCTEYLLTSTCPSWASTKVATYFCLKGHPYILPILLLTTNNKHIWYISILSYEKTNIN